MAADDTDNLVLRLLREMRAETAAGFAKVDERFTGVEERITRIGLGLADVRGIALKSLSELVRGRSDHDRIVQLETAQALMRDELDALMKTRPTAG
jgi:hypothetical protein